MIHLWKGKKTGRLFVIHHNKYYRNSATGTWIKISSLAKQLATGNIGGIHNDLVGVWTGKIAEALQAAGSLDDPMVSGEEVIDLSKNAPAGFEVDTADSSLPSIP